MKETFLLIQSATPIGFKISRNFGENSTTNIHVTVIIAAQYTRTSVIKRLIFEYIDHKNDIKLV